ncbi:hypothetical protein G6F56_012274 [Rhizopus delemar]|nr:hypothetical protein G6F56_012274 [Rhizopus delemar]
MSTNKQSPLAAINEDEIYSGAEANNVESSRAQAPDIESEIEEERQQRRKSFSEEEDKQLCRYYLLISLNAVHGTERKGETFWSRIAENYKQAMRANYFERHVHALPVKWQIINKTVNNFSGILSQIKKSKTSGSNDKSNEDKAKQIYRAEVRTNFNLLHYKKILDRRPKWQDYQVTVRPLSIGHLF